jgi:nicotinamide mononucleotide (NMN) deamidase PncC
MAEHVCNLFSSDWGVAVTGYAAPVPQNKEKFLFSIYSVAFHGHVVATNKIKTGLNDPLKAQFYYTNEILLQLSELLKKR